MRLTHILRLAAAAGLGATALNVGGLAAPALGKVADPGTGCLRPMTSEQAATARGGASGLDHRDMSAAEQLAIARRTDSLLAARGATSLAGVGLAGVVPKTVPVYVHVMRNDAGRGDVTNAQIARQIAVLNTDFGNTGYSFNLVSTDRFNNSAWHQDQQSALYRSRTRLGGARALNIWVADIRWFGIATFPWDYASEGAVDGIRVDLESLPGGSIIHYNEGKTAVHETGHWLGLFHTFQGGCSVLNDQVADTPAQATPTTGCPATRDSCPMDGTDPIHNYMDYSWDSCYTEFTQGQVERMDRAWAAYRA